MRYSTEERCERTELLVSDCAHCRGSQSAEEQVKAETVALRARLLSADMGWFPAEHPDHCARCGEFFRSDTLIRFWLGSPTRRWIAECCEEHAGG